MCPLSIPIMPVSDVYVIVSKPTISTVYIQREYNVAICNIAKTLVTKIYMINSIIIWSSRMFPTLLSVLQ